MHHFLIKKPDIVRMVSFAHRKVEAFVKAKEPVGH